MSDIILTANKRADQGKGASRRLRKENMVPAIVYGAKQDPLPITLDHNHLIKAQENEEFYSQILTLNINDKSEQVVVKDIQRHPYKPRIMHMDFLRIKADELMTMSVPLHFLGESSAPGVKEGGIVSHLLSEVEIRCLPANLPKYVEVDVSQLGLNDNIHLSDLKLPEGVEIPALAHGTEYDQPILVIHVPRAVDEAPVTPVSAEEAAAAAAAVPATKVAAEGSEGKE